MTIGIDASRAFIKNRTGIEEYSYQVIKHLKDKLNGHQVVLYSRNVKPATRNAKKYLGDLELPENWKVKIIRWPYLWTQVGLSLEMLFNPVDILFVPAHTVPVMHPRDTVVTIHGLEYEFCPKAYSWWERFYMRCVIKNSCKWAKKIIAVSNNTKQDLMKLYKVPEEKTTVIYEGYDNLTTHNSQLTTQEINKSFKFQVSSFRPYLLFIGRLEERKNIIGIIKAFEILKEQYKIPHKLMLAGKFGYGEEKIRDEIKSVNCTRDIILPGYVSEGEKWDLLRNADVFLFPTFYEGFGIPILEAQSVGLPVVAGNNSSVLEVVFLNHPLPSGEDAPMSIGAGEGTQKEDPSLPTSLPKGEKGYFSALLVNPRNAEKIADATYKLISDKNLRDDIIKRGYENVKRFGWEHCTERVAQTLMETNIDTKFNKK